MTINNDKNLSIAVLVLAYSAPNVLARTITILKSINFDFYVHLDAKADEIEYKENLGDSASNCLFLEDRINISWGGFTMIKAELLLVKTAMYNKNYDKLILISDDSFPIKPYNFLIEFFSNKTDQITLKKQLIDSPFYHRYENFYCYDNQATTVRYLPNADRRIPERIVNSELEIQISEISFLRRLGKKVVDIYWGPQFWALTSETIKKVMSFIDSDLHFVKSFEYSALPDESFIHSIIGNYICQSEMETGPIFSDFSGGGPRVFSEINSLPLDLGPNHAFIRKVSNQNIKFLDAMFDNLIAGKTASGLILGDSNKDIILTDKVGQKYISVRLNAPQNDEDMSGWHGIEIMWGRKFRWSSDPIMIWEKNVTAERLDYIKIVICTAISCDREWLSACCIEINEISKPVIIDGGEIYVEFSDLAPGDTVVKLKTPTPRTPPDGYHDRRHLGLAITL